MSQTRIEVPAQYVAQITTGGGASYFNNQAPMLVQGLAYLRAAYGGPGPGQTLAVAVPWRHGPRMVAAAFTIQPGPPPPP